MPQRTMRLFEDRIEGGARPIYLPRGDRAIFIHSGNAQLVTETTTQHLTADHAYAGPTQLTVVAGAEDVVLWRWELADAADLEDDAFLLRSAPQTHSELKLSADFDIDDRYDWLLRCDTVTFPPGGVAWSHLHQGPGIRMVHHGEITIETEGLTNVHRPGDAWAEKGVLPVHAPAAEQEETKFVRCFILPSQNRGVSSLRTIKAEDRAKPNTQSYLVLAEYLIG